MEVSVKTHLSFHEHQIMLNFLKYTVTVSKTSAETNSSKKWKKKKTWESNDTYMDNGSHQWCCYGIISPRKDATHVTVILKSIAGMLDSFILETLKSADIPSDEDSLKDIARLYGETRRQPEWTPTMALWEMKPRMAVASNSERARQNQGKFRRSSFNAWAPKI